MSTVSDGSYYILNVKNTNLCIDVSGGLDDEGRNVQLYNLNRSEAQMMQIVTIGGHQRLRFPLTGKYIDVACGKIANGSNIQQYTSNGSSAQNWKIESTESSKVYNGSTYTTYKILLESNTNYCLNPASTSPQAGTNLNLWSIERGGDDQEWIFIEIPTLQEGTYSIRTALDTGVCIDNSCGSLANGSQLQLWNSNDTNSQKFMVKNNSDGTVTIYDGNTLLNTSMKAHCISGNNPRNIDGIRAYLWTDAKNPDQEFFIILSGNTVRNGEPVPTYIAKVKVGSGKVLDAACGSTRMGTAVQFYTSNGSLAQTWEFRRDEFVDSSLPTPSDVRLSYVPDRLKSRSSRSVWVNTNSGTLENDLWTTLFNVNFVCAGTSNEFKMRYRIKYRNAKEAWGEFGPWKSIQDSSSANGGWGNAWMVNCTTDNTGTTRWTTQSIPITLGIGSNDSAKVEIQVARSLPHMGKTDPTDQYYPFYAHSIIYDQSDITVTYKPNITFGSAVYTPDGIYIPITSDFKHNGNKITISGYLEDGTCVFSNLTYSDLTYNDTLKINYDLAGHVPVDGAKLTLKWVYTTIDTNTGNQETIVPIAFDANHGITLSPTYKEVPELNAVDATFSSGKTTECYVLVVKGHKSYLEKMPLLCTNSGKSTFRCFPPIGVNWRIFCLSKNSDDSWGSHDDVFPPIAPYPKTHNWNSLTKLANGWQLAFEFDKPIKLSRSLKANLTKSVTTGREHEVVTFGRDVASEFSVSGVVLDPSIAKLSSGNDNATEAAFDDLAYTGSDAEEIIYRSPWGDWAHVVIESVSMPKQWSNRSEISVSMLEVTP